MKKSKTATFRLAKETKGTFMFEELDAAGNPTVDVMGNVYVRKSVFEGTKPETITLTVSF